MKHFGSPACDGSAMTYKLVPQDQLARISSKMSWPEAGAIQPLAIAVQTTRQAGNFAQKNVIILGGGCIGSYLVKLTKL
jgi:threonine dehydrogenase-like Zn-dependent dehydrogenase